MYVRDSNFPYPKWGVRSPKDSRDPDGGIRGRGRTETGKVRVPMFNRRDTRESLWEEVGTGTSERSDFETSLQSSNRPSCKSRTGGGDDTDPVCTLNSVRSYGAGVG